MANLIKCQLKLSNSKKKKRKKINVIYGNWINFLKYNNKIIKYNNINQIIDQWNKHSMVN